MKKLVHFGDTEIAFFYKIIVWIIVSKNIYLISFIPFLLMLSLYIHVPFCHKKCSYCNFQVCPINDMDEMKTQELISTYVQSLEKEILFYAEKF